VSAADEKLIVGRISGVYGVKGWVKVYSDTDPREAITDFNPWYLKQSASNDGRWREVRVEAGRPQAKTVIAKLEGCDDRDAALLLTGAVIGIDPEQLPALPENEYYWRDLIGLRVINTEGVDLGIVRELRETGANDVLIVRPTDAETRERLIPWTPGHAVIEVDLQQGRLLVDWDQDF
jgi:16S rRNA processing protein RimM